MSVTYKGKVYKRIMPVRRRRKPLTVKKVKEIINDEAESGYKDTNSTINTAVVNDSKTEAISLIAVGNDIVSRKGSRIELNSIQLKGYVDGNQNAERDTIVRILIWSADDCKGEVPDFAPTDVLVADSVERMRDVNHMSAYKVYFDKMFTLPMRTIETSHVIPTQVVTWYRLFKTPIKIRYTADTAVIGSCSENAFFITLMTNQALAQAPSFTYSTRLRFKDV